MIRSLAIPIRANLLGSIVFTVLAGCSHNSPRQDRSLSAIEAGDSTALVEACGNQLVPGYTYCRFAEKQPATGVVAFVAPPVECSRTSCVNLKLYTNNALDIMSYSYSKGQTRFEVPWRDLIHRDQFEVSDRGFWPYVFRISFVGDDGIERTLIIDGEIRVRVYKAGYEPLNNASQDPNFAWEFIENGTKVKMTTGGRVYVAPRGKSVTAP